MRIKFMQFDKIFRANDERETVIDIVRFHGEYEKFSINRLHGDDRYELVSKIRNHLKNLGEQNIYVAVLNDNEILSQRIDKETICPIIFNAKINDGNGGINVIAYDKKYESLRYHINENITYKQGGVLFPIAMKSFLPPAKKSIMIKMIKEQQKEQPPKFVSNLK